MMSDYTIVRQDRFVEATRDSGYKSTASALSELIDNSLQAMATSVAVEFVTVEEESNGRGRPKLPRVVEVLVADNGRGMDAETLRRSLRFGDSSRFDDRNGLGRFGMGLPNASVSQARRVEVYSWVRGCKPLFTFIDVDLIAQGKQHEVPEPQEVPIPVPYAHLANTPSGTLVVWKKCDRLDQNGKKETIVRELRPNLGRTFRYYLIQDVELTVDDVVVGPIDPLYLMPQARIQGDLLATQHGDTLQFKVPVPGKPGQTAPVEVTISLLPVEWQIQYGPNKTKDQKAGMKARHIVATTGFSLVRANREIDLVRSPYHAPHWKDRWYRVEVRFDPELDEVFGVTHTKQHARILKGSPIANVLAEAIKPNVVTLLDTIEHRRPKRPVETPNQAEEAARQVDPLMKPVEGVAGKDDDMVRQEIDAFLEERVQAGATQEQLDSLGTRVAEYPVIIEYEQLPGAPVFRVKVVGRTIIVMLNTSHIFYQRVYRRLEEHSSLGKTGVDLLLMSLARSEVGASEEGSEWYDTQRQEWSQSLRRFLLQLPSFEPSDSEELESV